MAASVATILARLGLDNRDFRAGLRDSLQHAGTFSKDLLQLPSLGSVLGGAGIAAAFKSIIAGADQIQDFSERYKVNTTILQQWGEVANENGASVEDLARAFGKLEVARSKALTGDQALLTSFTKLGVSVSDLKTLSPDELMKKIGASSLDASALVLVLGKNAIALRPTLDAVASGAAKFGAAINEIDIKRLADADDLFKRMQQNIKVFAAEKVVSPIVRGAGVLKEDFDFLVRGTKQEWDLIGKTFKGGLTPETKAAWKDFFVNTLYREGVMGIKKEAAAVGSKAARRPLDDDETATGGGAAR
jgi:hypothetical protein